MTTESPPRSRAQRRRDTEYRLGTDIDVWVARASADGAPYLVPLSLDWDGEAMLMVTPTDSPTAETWPPPEPFAWGWAAPATSP